MVDAHLLRQLGGVPALVVMAAVVEAHGEGLLPAKIAGHKAGIHAAGEEAAHLHIADAVRLH